MQIASLEIPVVQFQDEGARIDLSSEVCFGADVQSLEVRRQQPVPYMATTLDHQKATSLALAR